MVCEKERIEFLAVAIFSFAYSKTEMAAAFLYVICYFTVRLLERIVNIW